MNTALSPLLLQPRPAMPWWIIGRSLKLVVTLGSAAAVQAIGRALGRMDPIPDNVPRDRVVDFDFMAPAGAEHDVTMAWKRLHSGPDIVWTPHNGGHWIVTRAEDIELVQTDSAHFSHRDVTLPKGTKPFQLLPLEADAPQHSLFRTMVSPWFSPKVVKALESDARQLAIDLIERLQPRRQCEFVDAFAQQFPIGIFLRLVDLPAADRPRLLRYTQWSTRGNPLKRLAGMIMMHVYIGQKCAGRSRAPGEDLISRVVVGEIEGRRLSEVELHGLLSVLVFGGLDTVAAMLSFITRFLAEHPQHRQQLIDNPALIPGAVDELIRRHGVTNTSRVLTQDYEFKGLRFKAGDVVQVPNALFGLDERRFQNPLEVDFSRPAPIRHAAFGNGPHRCAGAVLARMEITVFLQEWLARIPHFRITTGAGVKTASGLVNAVETLPLSW